VHPGTGSTAGARFTDRADAGTGEPAGARPGRAAHWTRGASRGLCGDCRVLAGALHPRDGGPSVVL